VIAYWSRVLQSAERNYSPTEREALALKEGLIKFQPFVEGEKIIAITDHAALTWSRTFQNVNRRLLTWGLVFSAYLELKIVHQAGRVHSNVDPVSRLRRRVPHENGPSVDATEAVPLGAEHDPMRNMYSELGEHFEERLMRVAMEQIRSEDTEVPEKLIKDQEVDVTLPHGVKAVINYSTAVSYAIMIGIDPAEVNEWRQEYLTDPHFAKILKDFKTEKDISNPTNTQYHYSDQGLMYFEDSRGNSRLCVPRGKQHEVMADAHDTISETAHAGYHKTYNKIAATYYWPRMSRDIKRYVTSCDICQKSKPRRHGPTGLLQPIPIPTQPFEVVTMDFIPELPESSGYDNILVIVDKLTKYALFIPVTTKIKDIDTARLFFHHVIAQYGIPRQIISDRDAKWRGDFWKEICRLLGSRRSLTTAFHPQADGQTEIMNQTLEIALRAYVGPQRDDWADKLDAIALAYNSTPHTATGFSPAYLLRGYHPVTTNTLMHQPEAISRPHEDLSGDVFDPEAEAMIEAFNSERILAQEALQLGHAFQKSAYNNGRLQVEFEEGDQVLINPHSLKLLRDVKGKGQKLLMKYDGPFEIMQKISPVAYRLRIPSSYGNHPVLNIAHLEKYQPSPTEFQDRPTKSLNRADFDDPEQTEWELEKIVKESTRKGTRGRRILIYRVRYAGYGPEEDRWMTRNQLKNVPDLLEDWKRAHGSRSKH
jgi:transposase InsO family protein